MQVNMTELRVALRHRKHDRGIDHVNSKLLARGPLDDYSTKEVGQALARAESKHGWVERVGRSGNITYRITLDDTTTDHE